MLHFKPTFSLSCFSFIKRLFSSSSLSAIKVVSSAYLRLLIFLPAIFISACASSSPVFLLMCSAYKLNKQGDNIQPWRTPFLIWNQTVSPCLLLNCCFLTCIQISQQAGQVVLVFPSLEFSTVCCDLHKGFGVINKAEVDVFLVFSCFFDDPTDIGYLISGSSAFSKSILKIWKFMVHILLKPGLENFERYFASVWDECNWCVVAL